MSLSLFIILSHSHSWVQCFLHAVNFLKTFLYVLLYSILRFLFFHPFFKGSFNEFVNMFITYRRLRIISTLAVALRIISTHRRFLMFLIIIYLFHNIHKYITSVIGIGVTYLRLCSRFFILFFLFALWFRCNFLSCLSVSFRCTSTATIALRQQSGGFISRHK